MVQTHRGSCKTRLPISASGTRDKPHWPHYPGMADFAGTQLHARGFGSVEEFAGQRVLVLGGGTSAVQFLLKLASAGVEPAWSTRRPPEFTSREFDPAWGRDVERPVNDRTSAGLLPLTPKGAVFADGSTVTAVSILWGTGFRASMDHPAPLKLRERGGPGQAEVPVHRLNRPRPATAEIYCGAAGLVVRRPSLKGSTHDASRFHP